MSVSIFESDVILQEIPVHGTVSEFRAIIKQRVIRREPKIECYVLTKVKIPPFFAIILRQFLVIFSTPTFISFTKLKIRQSF